MTLVLYFNGLGDGSTRFRERVAIHYLARRGVQVAHVPINWRSGETFPGLLERMLERTKQELLAHDSVVLVGSSAGGSLALNIFGALHEERVYAVTLCSRVCLALLPRWDKRSLEKMAYIGKSNESRNFFDSVTYCSHTTIPGLTSTDRQRIVTVQQWADFVVPRPTMSVPGVHIYRVPGVGHGMGIMVGALRLPSILRQFSHKV